jgi:hypothetical protein
MAAVRHLEEAEQVALIQWAQYRRVPEGQLSRFIVAVPNGTYLGGTPGQRAFQMARLKAAGLAPGAGDLLVALARGGWHSLWIEMKKPFAAFRCRAEAISAVSEDQLAFGEAMKLAGSRYLVCYGFEDARHAIENYLDGRDIVMGEGTA